MESRSMAGASIGVLSIAARMTVASQGGCGNGHAIQIPGGGVGTRLWVSGVW